MRCGKSLPPPFDLLSAIALSSSHWYSGICAAFKISDGLVVASRGAYCFSVAKSPVSATTTVNCFNWSSWLNAVEAGAFGVSTAVLIIFRMFSIFIQNTPPPRNGKHFDTAPAPRRMPADFLYGHTLSRLRPRRRQRPAHARNARKRQNHRRRTSPLPQRPRQDQRRAALEFCRAAGPIEDRPEKSRRAQAAHRQHQHRFVGRGLRALRRPRPRYDAGLVLPRFAHGLRRRKCAGQGGLADDLCRDRHPVHGR